MSIAKVSVILSAMAVASCGASKKADAPAAAQSPKISEDAAKAEAAKLPGVVIVKVPVDANGKEVHDKAEMRLVDGTTTLSQTTIASTFDAAKAPAASTDELDKTSSTESFCGWAFGVGFRNRYYPSSYGWNWNFYRPTYLNYGYNYGYNYGGSYGVSCGGGCGGYGNGYNGGYGNGYNGYSSSNYYYYNSSFGSSYSGQGWNPGVSYTGGMY